VRPEDALEHTHQDHGPFGRTVDWNVVAVTSTTTTTTTTPYGRSS
jgi:hypothetical protein